MLDALTFGHRDELAPVPMDVDPGLLESSAFANAIAGSTTLKHEPAKRAADTPASIVERLTERGVHLEVAPDGNLVVTRKGGVLPLDCAAVIVDFRAAIVAHLRGSTLACSWCAKPAEHHYFGGARACAKHAER
jgi:hypothetical protein